MGPRWSSGSPGFPGLSSTLPSDDRAGAVLFVLASVFGDQCERVLRVCAATGTTLGEALVDLPREWGVGRIDNPTPSHIKLMCREVAVAVGLLPPRGEEAVLGDLLDFLAMDCAVVRRRYKHTQRWYVEMGLLDGAPPLLTLSVPPRTTCDWHIWASRQPTAGDDCFGVREAGRRFNPERLLALDFMPLDMRQSLVEGVRYVWSAWPPRCTKKNYQSCVEHAELAAGDFDRLIAMGLCEGPLDYAPWVVNPIACIVKWDPLKVRNVMDALRSGVNEYMVRVLCELDMVHVVAPLLLRGMAVSKFDIADAFLVWPVFARDCEVQGFRHPATGEYYRYRFMPFGLKQAPGIQQRWARFVLDVVQRLGLRYCRPSSPEGTPANIRALGGYLDDFGVGHHPVLSAWQQRLQYWSVLCVLGDLGIPVKHSKNAWPSEVCEWTGLQLDTVRGVMTLSASRCAKLLARIEAFLRADAVGDSPLRLEWASLVGKLQFCCNVIMLGQARLRELYVARDVYDVNLPSSAAWLPDVRCVLHKAAVDDLRWWHGVLSAGGGQRRLLWHAEDAACLWGPRLLPILPRDLGRGLYDGTVAIITTDASGWAGGAWWEHRRIHYSFTPEQLAGRYQDSANLRELYIPLFAVRRWAVALQGRRILFLMDSEASVGAINRRGSMVPHFNDVVLALLDLLGGLGCEAIARHLPGVQNRLADGISRLTGRRDEGDWMMDERLYRRLSSLCGPFDVDACSDPLGHNAFCCRFWSALDSCLEHDWAELLVWCNPPFSEAEPILRHFWRCFHGCPERTAAVFILPVWTSASWWRFVGGGCVVGYWHAGSRLFTAPAWHMASRALPLPRSRVDLGPTNWPVVAVYFPPSCARPATSHPWHASLPRLRGSAASDFLFLRGMRPGVVSGLRRKELHRSS